MRFAPLSLLVLLGGLLSTSPSTSWALQPGSAVEGTGDSIPYLHGIATLPERPVDGDHVQLQFNGMFPYKCGVVSAPFASPFAIELRPWNGPCVAMFPGPWRWVADMGALRAGFYRVMYELHVVHDPAALPGDSVTVYHGVFEFAVARPDSQPPAGLPYVDAITIRRKSDMLPFERICPGDSIQVDVVGHFPSDCYSLTSIDVDLIRGFPEPQRIRITVDDHGCQDRACILQPVPWSARLVLGQRPTGHYILPFLMVVETCGTPHDSVFATRVPFLVDSCETPPPPGCLLPNWSGPGIGQCAAFISPAQPAVLTFQVITPVPLSGLQGQFGLGAAVPGSPNVRITSIDAVGPARGMHLSWVPVEDGGARFVLFAERGAPIVPNPDSLRVPILRVMLEVIPGHTPAPQTYLSAFGLLGSDIEGNAVPECNNFRQAPTLICSGQDCDDNGDGRVDVRDLVLLVHCLPPSLSCPDPSGFDCNQDGTFSLDDVICCARRILGRPDCPGCPSDTTPPRKEPQIRLSFGSPRVEGGRLTLPMQMVGTSRLGAARFALKYPADRYDVIAVEFPGAPPEWLTLYEIQGDQVVVGLIQISPHSSRDVPMDLVVRLALKSGQTVGGEVSYVDAEFSGPDGVPLEISMEHGTLPLGDSGRIALSENRPNPFAQTTTFSLTLDRGARVQIGVFDVGGRFVASIQDGPLAAGSHPFTWDGRIADGSVARSGIYFVRAVAGEQTVSRRVVLLRTQ